MTNRGNEPFVLRNHPPYSPEQLAMKTTAIAVSLPRMRT